MPSRLDALRARLAGNVLDGIQSVVLTRDECTALLAVADAATEFRHWTQLEDTERMARAWVAVDTALAALTTEEGDHSGDATEMVASPNPLLAAAIAALEPDAVCRVEDEHTDTPACLVCRGCALRAVLDAARRAPV